MPSVLLTDRTKDVIHQVYRAKPVQTFGDLEANLLQEPAAKQQQKVLSQVISSILSRCCTLI
ncbi:MAG: hypothetical protein ACJ71M_12975 [Nitrososphaeraceae archaeon]